MQKAVVPGLIVVSLALAVPLVARAHIDLLEPMSRNGHAQQKFAPCGAATDSRGSTVEVYEPGQTITVRWTETVNHPSHYRIAFDADGQDDLDAPVHDAATMRWITPEGVTVLADYLEDPAGSTMREASITLPDVECESCVLQLIQVIYNKLPYNDGDDIYYHCSDIALRRTSTGSDGGTPGELDAGTLGDAGTGGGSDAGSGVDAGTRAVATSGGCAVSVGSRGAGSGVLAMLGLAALGAIARRRRR